jgi:hypothetical protein
MKTKTVLKTIASFLAWLVSFQLITVGFNLMSRPSTTYFTLGTLLAIASLFGVVYFAGKMGKYMANLVAEYKENKQTKIKNN